MKKITLLVVVAGISAIIMYAGCGGGSSTPATPSSKAVLTFTSSGALASGTQIGGIDLTIALPAGVTAQASVSKENVSKVATYGGIVTASGVAASTNAITMATFTDPNLLRIQVGNPTGFGIGEFATVTCDIIAGSNVTSDQFTNPTIFSAVDLNGVPISGLSAGLAAVIQ